MKYTVFACFLFLFLLSPLCADTQIFDDAEKQFKKIRGPYAGARGAAYHSLRHKAVIKDVTGLQCVVLSGPHFHKGFAGKTFLP